MTVPLALPVEVSPMFSPSSTDTKGGPLFDSRQLTITTPPAMHSLEYEEEYDDDLDDLFGEEEDPLFVDTRKPVATPGAGPSKPSSSAPVRMPKAVKAKPITSGQESRRKEKFSTSRRLDELRMRKATIPPPPSRGVPSLRNLAMSVILSNAPRIWDIGGLEYGLCAELLDQLPREQLAEVETASEHIKPDTDWLWEIFVIEEYPLFYETCRVRNGRHRSSGWRRMYHKAVQESEERKEQAMERVAARYKELDAQRASKRVVVMEGLVAPQKKKSGWASWGGGGSHSLSGARRGASAASTYAQSGGNKALAKARAESNRARLALTKASGRFSGPPVVRTPRNEVAAQVEEAMFSNPYAGRAKVAQGPRIPRPRAPLPMERRGELPSHIVPDKVETPGERFSLGSRAPRAPRLIEEREKGKGKNREEPEPSKPTSYFEPKSRVLNAISDFTKLGSGSGSSSKRPREDRVKSERNGKKVKTEDDELFGSSPVNSPRQSPRHSPAPGVSTPRTASPAPGTGMQSPAARTASPSELGSGSGTNTPPRPLPMRPRKPQNLESVLFMKKKKPVKRP